MKDFIRGVKNVVTGFFLVFLMLAPIVLCVCSFYLGWDGRLMFVFTILSVIIVAVFLVIVWTWLSTYDEKGE